VWNELHEHLQKFLDSDVAPAKIGIKSEGEDMVVPQRVVAEVQVTIRRLLGDIAVKVDQIDKSKVSADESEREQQNTEEEPSYETENAEKRKARRTRQTTTNE
jgi:hypothetical protein